MSIRSANVMLQQVTAFNNQAFHGNGGAFFLNNSTFSLTDASLRSNSTGQGSILGAGGALGAMNTNVTFNRVQVLGNRAPEGGGISLGNLTGTTTVTPFAANITNSVFADNVSSNPATTATSGAIIQGVNANFTFTTFAQNSSSGSAVPAIRLANFGTPPPATVTLTDCIIANQTNTSGVAAVVVETGNTLTFNHVLSANNTLLDNSGASSGGTFNGENTVTTAADAQFVSPGAPDYDYSIPSSSPAVGRGTPVPGVTLDIDQQTRKSTPDLGAYESPPAPVARQTVATYDPGSGLWQIRNSNTTGFANLGMFTYGLGGNNSFPVVGDWNKTGKVGIGVVEVIRTSDPALPEDPVTHLKPYVLTWKLRNSQTSGAPDVAQFEYGRGIDIPVVGDWDGNRTTTVGIYEPDSGVWKLRNSNTQGTPDYNTPGQSGFAFGGLPGDLPVVGDWDGNGTTTVGVVERVGTGGVLAWKLRDSNSAGLPDAGNFAFGAAALGSFPVPGVGAVFGAADVQPITGDWNGDKRTTVGVFEPNGQWLLKDSNTAGAPDAGSFFFGDGQSRPLAADFGGLP